MYSWALSLVLALHLCSCLLTVGCTASQQSLRTHPCGLHWYLPRLYISADQQMPLAILVAGSFCQNGPSETQ